MRPPRALTAQRTSNNVSTQAATRREAGSNQLTGRKVLFVHQSSSSSRQDFKSSRLKKRQTLSPSLLQPWDHVRNTELPLGHLQAAVGDRLWEAGRGEVSLLGKEELWLDHWLPNCGASNRCFTASLHIHFQGLTGASCAWKALSKAGGLSDPCYAGGHGNTFGKASVSSKSGKANPLAFHRVTEWSGLEGTSVGHPAQPPAQAGSPRAGCTALRPGGS